KIGTARAYDDVRMAAKCGPDIILIDGMEASTGAGPHILTEDTGIPLIAGIVQARKALEDVGLAEEIDLVAAGGIRNGADVAKALALGARAVAIGTAALMALNCNKHIPDVTDYPREVGVEAGDCYFCHTGKCPVGITTQDPELIKRLEVEPAALRVYNLLHAMTLECQMLARGCGKTDIHNLEPEDLAALTLEASAMTGLPLAGTNWVVGEQPEFDEKLQRVLAQIAERGIQYTYFMFISVNGKLNGKYMPSPHFERTARNGIRHVYGATVDLRIDRHGQYIAFGEEETEFIGIP